MGTFNLGWSVGVDSRGAPIEAVGHVGDTYGYQFRESVVIWAPKKRKSQHWKNSTLV